MKKLKAENKKNNENVVIKADQIYLTVAVKPQAKKTTCLGKVNGVLTIAVHAPPIEGKANAALLHYLAELFHVPKSTLTIIRGEHSKKKVIALPFHENILTMLARFEI